MARVRALMHPLRADEWTSFPGMGAGEAPDDWPVVMSVADYMELYWRIMEFSVSFRLDVPAGSYKFDFAPVTVKRGTGDVAWTNGHLIPATAALETLIAAGDEQRLVEGDPEHPELYARGWYGGRLDNGENLNGSGVHDGTYAPGELTVRMDITGVKYQSGEHYAPFGARPKMHIRIEGTWNGYTFILDSANDVGDCSGTLYVDHQVPPGDPVNNMFSHVLKFSGGTLPQASGEAGFVCVFTPTKCFPYEKSPGIEPIWDTLTGEQLITPHQEPA